jgi:diguanylate cyclase (GGDEF)-like protein
MYFRSLRARIVVLFVGLFLSVQLVGVAVTDRVHLAQAERRVQADIASGEMIFRRMVEQKRAYLEQATTMLAADSGVHAATLRRDYSTLESLLAARGANVGAALSVLVSPSGALLAGVDPGRQHGHPLAFPAVVQRAHAHGGVSTIEAVRGGEAYQLVLRPVGAAKPIAWVAMGYRIDARLASELRTMAGVDVSFVVRQADASWSLVASSLPSAQSSALGAVIDDLAGREASTRIALHGAQFDTTAIALHGEAGHEARAIIQRARDEALGPYRELRAMLIFLGALGVLSFLLGGLMISRRITAPIKDLAVAAGRIEQGDYTQRVAVRSKDEVGALAASFDHMREAIATREQDIRRLAYRDSLTDLPNRWLFNERVKEAIAANARGSGAFSVLLLDLDRFKYINDTLGHHVGDRVLGEIGRRLKACLRDNDTVARLGGDEFAILSMVGDEAAATIVARKVLRAIEQPIVVEGQPLDVGASIGIAFSPEHGATASELMRHADMAMYSAKAQRSGFAIYQPGREESIQQHLSLLSELREAMHHGQLALSFQPIVDLRTRQVHAVEALLRWHHPRRGLVSPASFIPFAEQTGFIKEVTRWVIGKAVAQAAQWHWRGMEIGVAVNISVRDFDSDDFSTYVAQLLKAYALPPRLLCLELTESGLMEDPARALGNLAQLRALGVQLAIDDFGTGYSSLAYLKRLPVDRIKIDRSFVRELSTSKQEFAIVRSVIDLSHHLGLLVTAEGIEDADVAEILADFRCDSGQGYELGKPMQPMQFEQWLAARKYPAAATIDADAEAELTP